MLVGVLGVDHQIAPLPAREAFTRAVCDQKEALQSKGCVPLLTCNRAEVYFCARDLAEACSVLINLLQKDVSFSIADMIYFLQGRACFLHLARVTAGLESAILAETDIQRQVKQAYVSTAEVTMLSSPLHFLFQKSLKIAKSIRSEGAFLSRGTSMEAVLYELGEKKWPDFEGVHVAFLGNSATNRKILFHFAKKGMKHFILYTRHPSEFRELDHLGITIQSYDQLNDLSQVSMVVAATKADRFLVSEQQCQLNQNGMLICDLSVPRVVDPNLKPPCTLYNMEELSVLIQNKRVTLENELHAAQEEIDLAVERQIEIYQNKEVRQQKKVSVCA